MRTASTSRASIVLHSRAGRIRACEDKKRHRGSESLLICRCIPSKASVEGPRYACVSEHERCAGQWHGALHARAHS